MSVPRPQTAQIPDQPGAYLFRDADGRVVYVGKARSLRKRLASYWGKPLHPRTEAMTAAATTVEWIVVSSEVDALLLEYNLIQEHLPRFNIRYRDDKSYPYLALTVGERWPRAQETKQSMPGCGRSIPRSCSRMTMSSSSAGTRATVDARSGTLESRLAICSTGSSVSNGSRPVSIS